MSVRDASTHPSAITIGGATAASAAGSRVAGAGSVATGCGLDIHIASRHRVGVVDRAIVSVARCDHIPGTSASVADGVSDGSWS